jgi:hypothetical protein
MESESKGRNAANQLILTCVGLSVIFGIVVGELIDFESLGKLRLISLTPRGHNNSAFDCRGRSYGSWRRKVSRSDAPDSTHISRYGSGGWTARGAWNSRACMVGHEVRCRPIPFLPLAIVEFIGAAFLGAGLRQLLRRNRTEVQWTNEGPNVE